MKSQQTVTAELEKQYLHRLQLRLDRYLKPACRNCTHRVPVEVDLGDFGKATRYGCGIGKAPDAQGCGSFKCVYSRRQIEESLLNDIRDPAVCGAKEPKIAALLWVLHDEEDLSFFGKLKGLFRRE